MNVSNKNNEKEPDKTSPVYVFIADQLKPGDILLSTQQTSTVSQIIRSVTSSDFSHAALLMVNSLCIEAVDDGVRVVALGRVCVSDLRNVRVLRLRDQGQCHVAEMAAHVAKNNLYKPYWLRGAIAAPFGKKGGQSNGQKFFCSHFVAHCYLESGLDLFKGKDVEKVIPNDFLKLPDVLDDITDTVFRQETRKSAPSHILDLDGYPESGEGKFAILNREISKELSDELNQYSWFTPFVDAFHQFADWYLFFFVDQISDQHKEQFDKVLYPILERHRFSEFFSYFIPLYNPLTFISIEEWSRLLYSSELSARELHKEKERLVEIEKAMRASLAIYDRDLAAVESLWQKVSRIQRFKSARTLFDFYQERSLVSRREIEVVKSKIEIIENYASTKEPSA